MNFLYFLQVINARKICLTSLVILHVVGTACFRVMVLFSLLFFHKISLGFSIRLPICYVVYGVNQFTVLFELCGAETARVSQHTCSVFIG